MSRLGWLVVHIETTETITTLHHGCESEEEAAEWAKAWILDNPGEPFDDIFLLQDLNRPDERVCIVDVMMEEVKQDGR